MAQVDSLDHIRTNHDMQTLTRAQIAEKHGGGTKEYLPNENGRVVCACLGRDFDPGAPEVILPGDYDYVRHWASVLCKQGGSIPIYIWQAPDVWKHVGEYEVESFSQLPADIAQHTRSERFAHIPITSVIKMRQTARAHD